MAKQPHYAVNANGQAIPLPSTYAGDYIALGGTSRRYAYAPHLDTSTGVTISRRTYNSMLGNQPTDTGVTRTFSGRGLFENAATFTSDYAIVYPYASYYVVGHGYMQAGIEQTSSRAFESKTAALSTMQLAADAQDDVPMLKQAAAEYFTRITSITV